MTGKADRKKIERKSLVNQIKESATKEPEREPVIKTLPSKITTFDLATGGGLPLGQITNLVGDSSSGKTLLSCEYISAAKSQLKDDVDWFYDDVENRFSFDTKRLFGFEILKRGQKNSCTVEDFSANLKARLDHLKSGKTLIYVLDSFDALTSRAELKRALKEDRKKEIVYDDIDEKEKGSYNLEKQKKLGEFFRLRSREIKDKNCILIIISQVRMNIGVMFGAKYYRTGGKALDHWASLIIWLAEAERHKKKNLTYGITTKCKITKVGNDKPFRECMIDVIFDYGVDNITGNILYLFNQLTDRGQRKREIKDLEWDGKKFDLKELVTYIEENNQEEILAKKVVERWQKIESFISSKNRKSKW